jgi:creatinine amidohydrolase
VSTDVQTHSARLAVLPIGSFEQHGSFLPLATDTIVACAVANAAAAKNDVLLLPPLTLSCSHEHSAYPGTVSISSRTLAATVADVAESLEAAGIRNLILVNGHGGNYTLNNVVQEANTKGPRMSLFPSRQDWEKARVDAALETSAHEDMHGGELEVSILLHVTPELVRDEYRHGDHLASDRPHLLVLGMQGYTESGIIGRPSLGSAEKGQALLDSLSSSFAAHLKLLDANLPGER